MRCRIYATDMDEAVLKGAKEGNILAGFRATVLQATLAMRSGTGALSDYYTGAYGQRALFRPSLRDNIIFSQHNLAMDSYVLREFHMSLLCRNVMIYFAPDGCRSACTLYSLGSLSP